MNLNSSNDITLLTPQKLWQVFDLFTQSARPSRHEEKVLQSIEALCEQHGLIHKRDEIGNLIISKPATSGMENRTSVVMQGHIDMVPQKNSDSSHDFNKDPITTLIDGDWVTADGTTLGADNGIGVAAALAILISDDIPHGPLELLITIDEESGMTGANNLKPGWLESDILINLDTEDEGEIYVGCAGGVDVSAQIPMMWESVGENKLAFELALTGLRGGHSGLDIDKGRGNANKFINRFLMSYGQALGLQVFSFNGGTLRNALARESFTKVIIEASKKEQLEIAVKTFMADLNLEFESVETNLALTIKPIDLPEKVYTQASSETVIHAVAACLHGVARMSPEFEGVVETSNNLAIVQSNEDHVSILCLVRSLSNNARDDLGNSIAATFKLANATTKQSGVYPGWKPDPSSKILSIMSDVYQNMFNVAPKVKVIHAGLECGLLSEPYPHWDMISIGPTIRHAHSPDEKVHIESVNKFWDYLLKSLSSIPIKI